jgi:dipeptidyl aminopeptidase/acylaminoacyl peptidase
MIALLAAAALAVQPAPLVRQRHDLDLSPSGDRVVALEVSETGEEVKTPHDTVVIRSTKDGAVLQTLDPCPTCRYGHPVWSPKGDALAFVITDRRAHTVSLAVAEGDKLRTVASFSGIAGQPRWSPDGGALAFLATPGAMKETGATQAGVPLVGEIGEADDEQRIAFVPVAGGEMRFASPGDTFVYEYAWTPDSKGFVATAAKGNGDNNWWIAKLEAFDAATGAERVIAAPKMQMNYPRISPDGKTVMVIGGLMSDFGPVGGDLWAAPFSGGELKDVTPGFNGTFTSLDWQGAKPMTTALVSDTAEIVALDPTDWSTRTLWGERVGISATELNGKAVFADGASLAATVIQDYEHGPEIALIKLDPGVPGVHPRNRQLQPRDQLRIITHDNKGLAPQVAARSITWKSDGFEVQGWLLAPREVQAGKTYPLIVQVHGGPSSAVTPTFTSHGTVRDLVAHGYWVFLPNPRGSYGQGEAFTRANVKDFGGGDLRDILAGVDAVEKVAPIDDKRVGVIGHSYGGFMTMWAVGHTDRFHAAVAGAGLSNWMSYYGENGIDQWMVPFFGATAYEDPATYERMSPIYSVRNIKTPTFIYVGERDVEVPAPQSQEFWHGLKAMGVPTSLMIYPGEGHGIREPEHVHDLTNRIVSWFDKYLAN